MPTVADTSPINYLVLIGAVEILPQLFGEVLIPEAVSKELLHPLAPERVRHFMAACPGWLRIEQLPAISLKALEHLDAGEADAIRLAVSTGAQLLIMDDRAGVTAAHTRRLSAIGTIGVLDAAARHGMVNLTEALEELAKTTFRMPKRVLQQLLSGKM